MAYLHIRNLNALEESPKPSWAFEVWMLMWNAQIVIWAFTIWMLRWKAQCPAEQSKSKCSSWMLICQFETWNSAGMSHVHLRIWNWMFRMNAQCPTEHSNSDSHLAIQFPKVACDRVFILREITSKESSLNVGAGYVPWPYRPRCRLPISYAAAGGKTNWGFCKQRRSRWDGS